jgi:uncharacterized damage-inducible protein DinB
MKHSKTLINLLQSTFNGKPWYGKPVMASIKDVSPKRATLRVNNSYNIAELLAHMIAWRKFTLAMLTKEYDYSVNDEDNFPHYDEINAEKWDYLTDRLKELQVKLIEALENSLPQLDLDEKVPGKSYKWNDLLFGLINHDVYHAGQINFLKKFA